VSICYYANTINFKLEISECTDERGYLQKRFLNGQWYLLCCYHRLQTAMPPVIPTKEATFVRALSAVVDTCYANTIDFGPEYHLAYQRERQPPREVSLRSSLSIVLIPSTLYPNVTCPPPRFAYRVANHMQTASPVSGICKRTNFQNLLLSF